MSVIHTGATCYEVQTNGLSRVMSGIAFALNEGCSALGANDYSTSVHIACMRAARA